ncbi:hypothetical protein HanPI659440_Chr03g0107151 [Helianthus annuus]|nr:hypothetical protein HanPI659440_Chr03g0107151 [Helianthus annuus]
MGPACFGAPTSKKGTEKKFEGRIPLEKFGQFAETEDVIAELVQVQPASVNAAQINTPINAMVAEEHDVQGAAEDEPETEILTINSDDEGIEIMCDSGYDEELPPENEADIVVSTVQSVISTENLALLVKSVTEKMGNPPSNLPVSNKEPPNEDPKDHDSLPVKRKRRDPRLGMYVEQNKDQRMNDAEDDDGLYDFDFEKNVTDTTTATEDIFEFDVYTQRMNVEIPTADTSVPTSVSDPIIVSTPSVTTTPAGPSRVFMKSLVVQVDSIHKDAKIIQLEDTIVQKIQQIDQLQGDGSLLFNMVYDLRGKLEKKFGQEFSDPTDVESRRKTAEDRARAFAKDDAERNAAMEHYFKRVTDPVADMVKAERIKKKREFVILKNKNLNPEDEDANSTHHLMDVGETLYDKVGNRSGVVRWGFDHDRRRWWIKRKVGPVEWYKNPAQFQTFTKVDLINLSKSPYVDDQPGGRGYLFFERLQREVARNFPSMHTAESIVTPAKGIRDPYTDKRMKIVHWPPTDKKRLFLWSRKFQKVL